MAYALKHVVTGELLAAVQTNGYQLRYFGILLWEDVPDEEERLAALARAGVYAQPGEEGAARKPDRLKSEWEQVQELGRWKPCALGEHEAKMANVKLRNDPRLRVILTNGELHAEEREHA
ncbi:hypothetical protein [Cohnella nanjingensis]|uniref:Uncharacterized protein n=1 Tax=Cohnella nanjingensis TaxID=1387779 RepID=A0A7X0VDI0_9BACL|nr:hypothetical protein [Cohnella nanjingensis]MBB6669218.1 hypothetical protein [Cohnella nanjingensis]